MNRGFRKLISLVIVIVLLNASLVTNINVKSETAPNANNQSASRILTGDMIKSLLAEKTSNNILTLPNGKKVISDVPVVNKEKEISIAKDTEYTYQRDVQEVDIPSLMQSDGTIKAPEGKQIQPGTILVDEANSMALYVSDINSDGTLSVRQPSMSELFRDLDINANTIPLSNSNMSDLQKAIYDARTGIHNEASDSVSIKKVSDSKLFGNTKSKFRSAGSDGEAGVADDLKGTEVHEFSSTPLTAYTGSGGKITVTLSGDIAAKLNLDAKYSTFGGYKLGVTGAEAIHLKVKLNAKMNEELYIPLFGIDANLGLGRVRAGIFLYVNLKGDITVVLSGGQGMSLKAGVKGGTCFGVPTSFHPYGSQNYFAKGECDPNGEISATVALAPSIDLSLLGIHVFNAELRLGLQLYAVGTMQKLKYGLSAIALFHVEVLGEGGNIFNICYKLFDREKEFYGGYFFYGNLCAYQDRLVFTVLKAETATGEEKDNLPDPFSDKVAYVGDVNIALYCENPKDKTKLVLLKKYTMNLSESDKGRGVLNFNPDKATGILEDIRKGYSVVLSIPDNPKAISNNIYATMPFKKLKIDKADYFNESAWGEVEPVNSHPDQPGLPDGYAVANNKNDLLYCENRNIQLYFSPKYRPGKASTITLKTDKKGRFRLDQIDSNGNPKKGFFDVRPNETVKAVADIDGFPFETSAIDTEAGLSLFEVTDCRTNVSIDVPVYDEVSKTYKTQRITGDNFDDLRDYFIKHKLGNKFSEETFTSGDHIIAINKYGYVTDEDGKVYYGRKINDVVNVKTEAYHTRRIDLFEKNFREEVSFLKAAEKSGNPRMDMRWNIMQDEKKDLLFSQTSVIPINEAGNNDLSASGNEDYKNIFNQLSASQSRTSTANIYRRLCLTDDLGKATKNGESTTNNIDNKNQIITKKDPVLDNKIDPELNNKFIDGVLNPKTSLDDFLNQEDEYDYTSLGNRPVLLKPRPIISKTPANDLTSINQPGGTDATLAFLPTPTFKTLEDSFNGDVYINTEASMNIEGITLPAVQWEPWISTVHLSGEENQQTTAQKVNDFLADPMNYMRQKIVIPADTFQNLKMGDWEPKAGTIQHQISIDAKNGTMTVDGVKTKLNNEASLNNGKMYVNLSLILSLMHVSDAQRSKIQKGSNIKNINTTDAQKAVKQAGGSSAINSKSGVMTITYKN